MSMISLQFIRHLQSDNTEPRLSKMVFKLSWKWQREAKDVVLQATTQVIPSKNCAAVTRQHHCCKSRWATSLDQAHRWIQDGENQAMAPHHHHHHQWHAPDEASWSQRSPMPLLGPKRAMRYGELLATVQWKPPWQMWSNSHSPGRRGVGVRPFW